VPAFLAGDRQQIVAEFVAELFHHGLPHAQTRAPEGLILSKRSKPALYSRSERPGLVLSFGAQGFRRRRRPIALLVISARLEDAPRGATNRPLCRTLCHGPQFVRKRACHTEACLFSWHETSMTPPGAGSDLV
jgi:hypothetical protein